MKDDYKIIYLNFNINPSLIPDKNILKDIPKSAMKRETAINKRYTVKLMPDIVEVKSHWTNKAIGKVALMTINNKLAEVEPKKFLNLISISSVLNDATWEIYNYICCVNPKTDEIKLFENMDLQGLENLVNPTFNIKGVELNESTPRN